MSCKDREIYDISIYIYVGILMIIRLVVYIIIYGNIFHTQRHLIIGMQAAYHEFKGQTPFSVRISGNNVTVN